MRARPVASPFVNVLAAVAVTAAISATLARADGPAPAAPAAPAPAPARAASDEEAATMLAAFGAEAKAKEPAARVAAVERLAAAEHPTIGDRLTNWVAKFGDPERHRSRPRVYQAIRACVKALTGKDFDGAKALAAWLAGARPR